MQLRKGLLAAATATAVFTSGVTVASAETVKPEVVNTADSKKTTESKQTTQSNNSSSSSDPDRKKMTPKEIQEWIAVVTAVIGLVGTLFTFADKFLKP